MKRRAADWRSARTAAKRWCSGSRRIAACEGESGVTVGPLNRLGSSDLALSATSWHKRFGQWVVFGLIGLHLAAIAFHVLIRKRILIRPMISGDKAVASDTPASADGSRHRSVALVLAVVCAMAVTWVIQSAG